MRGAVGRVPSHVWALLASAALVAVVLTLHAPTLAAYFYEDDVQWLLGDGTWPIGLFSLEGRDHFFRPVVEVYFMAQSRLWGASPVAFHLANVLLHALNALLVFVLARRVLTQTAPACAAALLFALHPRAVEMVAWVSGVTGVLMTSFVLITVLLHLRFLETRRGVWRAGAAVSCACALLTHEAAVVLLVLLPLVGVTAPARADGRRTLEPPSRRRAAGDLLPYLLLAAAFAWASFTVNRHNYVVTEGRYRLGWHAAVNLARYLVSIYVGRQEALSLVLTALAVAAAGCFGRGALRLGAVWMVAALLPYSFFAWSNTNRYLYLPAIGFVLLTADLLQRLGRQRVRGRPAGIVVAAVLCAVLAGRSAHYARKTARDVAARSEPYREYVAQSRALYPRPARGAVLVVPEPGPGGPARVYVEPLLRVTYEDPTLSVRFGDDRQGVPRTARGER